MKLTLDYQEIANAIAYYLKHTKSIETKSVYIGEDPSAFGYKIIATVEPKDG